MSPRHPHETPETWVLLRGLSRGSAHWGGFIARLQQALPGAHLLTPELLGNGALFQQTSPASVPALTDAVRLAVRAELARSGLAGPVNLLAMSLGAMLACDWAQRYPQELQSAVLINTSLRPFSPWWQRLRPERYPGLLRRLLLGASADDWERHVLDITSQLTARDAPQAAALLAEWLVLRQSQPVAPANALRQLLAAARFHAPALAPPVPMLVLLGEGDQLVHPECSRRLAQAWQLPLRAHPLAGHDLPLDDGAWVAQQVAAWRTKA